LWIADCPIDRSNASPVQTCWPAEALRASLHELYSNKNTPFGAITVIVESAWMPMILVDTSTALWSSAQVETLAQHKIGAIFENQSAPSVEFQIRLEYRVGDNVAVAYGFLSSIRAALLKAATGLSLKWDYVVPAFAWGVQRFKPSRKWAKRTGWWAWPEQDRLLLARFSGGRVDNLNAAAQMTVDPANMQRLIKVEAIRTGTPTNGQPIAMATWASVSSRSAGATNFQQYMIAASISRRPASPTASALQVAKS
jgi:hypothetical protein